MRPIASGFIVVLVLLLLGVPVSAQDQFTAVSFDGVAFAFGPELGESVDVARVPARSSDQPEVVAPDAAHVTFTLYGPSQEGGRTPRVGFTDASVRAYRTADLAGDDAASGQVDALRALLEDRSALAGFMTVSDDGGEPLPHLPVDTAAAQALRARATFIETSDLTGIAYLIGYRQDLYPFAAGDFVYTFQAISTDGEWYVSGDFIVEAAGFPQRIRPRDARDIARRWEAYLEESIRTLNAAAPDTFAPPLTAIDALIDSIVIVPPVGG